MATPNGAGTGDSGPGRGAKPSSTGAGQAANAAWLMTGSVAFGVLAGFFLDRRFHSDKHLFLLGGSLIGLISGFTSLLYATQRLGK